MINGAGPDVDTDGYYNFELFGIRPDDVCYFEINRSQIRTVLFLGPEKRERTLDLKEWGLHLFFQLRGKNLDSTHP